MWLKTGSCSLMNMSNAEEVYYDESLRDVVVIFKNRSEIIAVGVPKEDADLILNKLYDKLNER